MASGSILIGRNQNARFQKNLKAVAHAQDQFLGVAEFAKFIPQKVSELIRQDFPCRNIVTITEAAGNHEDLVAMQQFGIFAEAVDVDWFRFAPARSKANWASPSQLVPGARKINTFGVVMMSF